MGPDRPRHAMCSRRYAISTITGWLYGPMVLDKLDPDAELATLMSEQARTLHEARSLDETLQGITQAAVQTIPGADWASVTMVTDHKELETQAPTDPITIKIDQAQYDTGEGPCLSALWEAAVVRADDIATDDRWPTWAEQVRGLGVGSMLSFVLFVRGDTLGALNTYAAKPWAYEPESESVGMVFASHAAIALSGAEEIAQLRQAASSRDVIGQAKGILMERYDLDADSDAFNLLVRASQTSHIKLHDVARQIVDRRREFRAT
jgi:GAF domain-containing protein